MSLGLFASCAETYPFLWSWCDSIASLCTQNMSFSCFHILNCLQVLETRAELDSLEEIANCPMVARRAKKYSAFFEAAPEMLQSTRSVADFETRLVDLLFPEATYLHCLAMAH